METYDDSGNLSLKISDLTPMDGGCYRCVAENDLGSDRTFAQVTISAKEKKEVPMDLGGRAPMFTKPLFSCRRSEGGSASFECQVFLVIGDVLDMEIFDVFPGDRRSNTNDQMVERWRRTANQQPNPDRGHRWRSASVRGCFVYMCPLYGVTFLTFVATVER